MARHENEKKSKKFDYKGYVSNLGKIGTFYSSRKDSKGVEGTLVSIAEKGVYAKVKDSLFPRLFARADFNGNGILKLNGKSYKLVEIKNDKKGSSNEDKDSYGQFTGKNGSKVAKKALKYAKAIANLNLDDDDEYAEFVELTKNNNKKS